MNKVSKKKVIFGKKMKKYISLLFIVILLIGFIGCKQFSEDNSEKNDDSIFPSVELVDIKIIAEPAKTEYFINEEELNLVGLKVIANYSDGKTEDVTPEVIIKGFNSALKTDSQIITVIFNKKKATFTIKIIGPAPEPEYNPETDPNNSENPPNDETYTVILESFAADKKIAVIKAIREITALGLGESKAFVESAPQVIKKGVSLKDADEIIKKIEEAGGKASKKGEI